MTKLPVKLFTSYEPDGPLCHILATAHRLKSEQALRRFDFSTSARMDSNVEMFMAILKELQVQKLWDPPAVFLDPGIPKQEAEHLAEIVKRHMVSKVCL